MRCYSLSPVSPVKMVIPRRIWHGRLWWLSVCAWHKMQPTCPLLGSPGGVGLRVIRAALADCCGVRPRGVKLCCRPMGGACVCVRLRCCVCATAGAVALCRACQGVHWGSGWHAQGWRCRVAGGVGYKTQCTPTFRKCTPKCTPTYPRIPAHFGARSRTSQSHFP